MRPTSFEAYAVSDVPETTEQRLCVVLEKTGERVWLPRSQVDVVRGHVFVPTWLAKKIKAFESERVSP